MFLFVVSSATAAELPRLTPDVRKKWWTTWHTPRQWMERKQAVWKAIETLQEERGTDWAMNDTAFIQWVGHIYWLHVFPPDWVNGREEDAAAYRALALEPQLPWLFLSRLRAEDDARNALKVLVSIYQAFPDVCRRYDRLAVALALVWDQPPGRDWPHAYVATASVPRGTETPLDRFKFYVRAHKAGKLLFDPRKLAVRDLVLMVDSPLPLSEMESGQKLKIKRPGDLVKIYSAVDYDRKRLDQKDAVWSDRPYTLSNIAQRGGICMDQAYMAWQTGKARGVPTILFSGLGRNGVHGWIGFMSVPGQWVLNAGRIQSQGYPVGRASHPQTRQPISDIELYTFQGRLNNHPAYRKARLILGWARMNEQASFYPALVLMARRLVPDMTDSWFMEDAWHVKNKTSPGRHAAFLEKWIDHFRRAPEIRFAGQKRLYRLYLKHDLESKAKRLHRQIVEENRSDRFDLGIHLTAETVFGHIEQNRWREAQRAFEKAMNEAGSTSRGHLFYGLYQPYVQTCVLKRQFKLARSALNRAGIF
ncbi:MAG: hypothetical protein AAF492_17540, partial [Verrucomicrobiota bacterium]